MGSQSKKPKIKKLMSLSQEIPENTIKIVKKKDGISFFAPLELQGAVEKAMKMGANAVIKEVEKAGL